MDNSGCLLIATEMLIRVRAVAFSHYVKWLGTDLLEDLKQLQSHGIHFVFSLAALRQVMIADDPDDLAAVLQFLEEFHIYESGNDPGQLVVIDGKVCDATTRQPVQVIDREVADALASGCAGIFATTPQSYPASSPLRIVTPNQYGSPEDLVLQLLRDRFERLLAKSDETPVFSWPEQQVNQRVESILEVLEIGLVILQIKCGGYPERLQLVKGLLILAIVIVFVNVLKDFPEDDRPTTSVIKPSPVKPSSGGHQSDASTPDDKDISASVTAERVIPGSSRYALTPHLGRLSQVVNPQVLTLSALRSGGAIGLEPAVSEPDHASLPLSFPSLIAASGLNLTQFNQSIHSSIHQSIQNNIQVTENSSIAVITQDLMPLKLSVNVSVHDFYHDPLLEQFGTINSAFNYVDYAGFRDGLPIALDGAASQSSGDSSGVIGLLSEADHQVEGSSQLSGNGSSAIEPLPDLANWGDHPVSAATTILISDQRDSKPNLGVILLSEENQPVLSPNPVLPSPPSPDPPLPWSAQFSGGVFTVGNRGEVGFDYLFDGGGYEGQVGIFLLAGLDQYALGSSTLLREVARRIVGQSQGYVVIDDRTEGAKISRTLLHRDANGQLVDWDDTSFNQGQYQGQKTVKLNPGQTFGIALLPHGSFAEWLASLDSATPSTMQPFLSLTTSDRSPTQFADININGSGNILGIEDIPISDSRSDRDYNDVVFSITGATGTVKSFEQVADLKYDWRSQLPEISGFPSSSSTTQANAPSANLTLQTQAGLEFSPTPVPTEPLAFPTVFNGAGTPINASSSGPKPEIQAAVLNPSPLTTEILSLQRYDSPLK